MASTLVATFQPGFDNLAERDVRAADRKARVLGTLGPPDSGVWHLAPGADDVAGDRLVAGLHDAMAFRHLHRAQVDVSITDLASIVAAVAPLGAHLAAGVPYAVQTRLIAADKALPKAIEINDAVAAALAPLGVPYDRAHPQQIVSLTIAFSRLLAGVGTTAENLSAWAGGARRFAKQEGSPSRAEHKLLEALEVFAFTPRGNALDLGAAPGGWTRVLAERGVNVTAVDPAELEPAIAAHPNVRWYRGTAERYLSARGAKFDLIACDVRMDARDAARLLLGFRAMLQPDGRVLTTLKLPERHTLGVLDQALELLDEGFTRVAARQLYHNRHEVTLLLAPRPSAHGSVT